MDGARPARSGRPLHLAQAGGARRAAGAVPRLAGRRRACRPPRAARSATANAAMPTACGWRREHGLRAGRPGYRLPGGGRLALFERDVLQPAAARHFGQPGRRDRACRQLFVPPPLWPRRGPVQRTCDRRRGRHHRLPAGRRDAHQRACDWPAGGPKAAFLRDVRDGACGLFATVLSPDYNAAHADHLHFDQAARGKMRLEPVPLARASCASPPQRKGDPRRRIPLRGRDRPELKTNLFQMVRQMLVHLEHAAAVLAEDLLQLVVRQDFSFVLRILQVVLANMIPDLRNHLAARQRIVARDRRQLR